MPFRTALSSADAACDLLLLNFTGQGRERRSLSYPCPDPDSVLGEIESRLEQLTRSLPVKLRARLHGVGVAAPLSLVGWRSVLGIDARQAARWAGIDIGERIAAMTDLPVTFVKDTLAACVAELVAGRGRSIGSFLYVFIDTFIGGGLVIDSQLRGGLNGNAGAVGSLSLGTPRAGRAAAPGQLLSQTSLVKRKRHSAHTGSMRPRRSTTARCKSPGCRTRNAGCARPARPSPSQSTWRPACSTSKASSSTARSIACCSA